MAEKKHEKNSGSELVLPILLLLLTTIDPYVMDERKKDLEEYTLLATVEVMLQNVIDMVRILQTIEITPCGNTT